MSFTLSCCGACLKYSFRVCRAIRLLSLNRVAYNNDVVSFDEEGPTDFSCVYVDVNELHLCNNKFGHAAGDAMLLYIANTLKKVF